MALDCKNFGEAVYLRDNIAVAVDYGYFRNVDHAFDSSPLTVLFIDSYNTYCCGVFQGTTSLSLSILESNQSEEDRSHLPWR